MPQAIVNPEDLERFARELKEFNGQIQDSMTRLQGQFSRLGETWRDTEHQKFAQEFEQTMGVMRRFMATSSQQIPKLQKKARIIREYLSQGGG